MFFNGRSIGLRIVHLRLRSSPNRWLSLVGCTVRIILLTAPPYLFFFLVYIPYVRSLPYGILQPPFFESFLLLFLVLICPVSIFFSKGVQGIHDSAFHMWIEDKGHTTIKHTLALRSFINSIILTAVIASSLTVAQSRISFVNKMLMYAFTMKQNYMSSLKEDMLTEGSELLFSVLKKTPYGDMIKEVRLGYVILDGQQSETTSFTSQPMAVPALHIEVTARAISKLQYLTKELAEWVHPFFPGHDCYKIECYRYIRFNLFVYKRSEECEVSWGQDLNYPKISGCRMDKMYLPLFAFTNDMFYLN